MPKEVQVLDVQRSDLTSATARVGGEANHEAPAALSVPDAAPQEPPHVGVVICDDYACRHRAAVDTSGD